MPVTIKSIAAKTGVSYQAVSAVLNNKTNCRVSPQKREHILNTARELGYKVNFGYKLMRGQATHTVGIVAAMRQIESDAHIRELILKLMHRLNLSGYATYFNNMMTQDADQNLAMVRELITRGTEHFIFIGSPLGHEAIEEEIYRSKCTLIGWNSFFTRNIFTDSRSASVELQAFLKQKSGTISPVMLPLKRHIHDNRFAALKTFCPGMSDDDIWDKYVIQVPPFEWNEADFAAKAFESAYNGMEEHFAKHPETRAVSCFTDNFALGAAYWCDTHGLKVGKDIFLAGFNNIEAVRFHTLPISSAAHPVDESIELLLQEMDKTQPIIQKIDLKVFLRN